MLAIDAEHVSSFYDDNVLTIGGRPCLDTEDKASVTKTDPDYSTPVPNMPGYYLNEYFECTVPDLEPGEYRMVVHVEGKGWGYTDLSTTTVLFHPVISGPVVPERGSLRGGLLLDIDVPNLSSADVAKTQVDIGSTPCPVQRIYSNSRIGCLTQAARDDGYSSVVVRSNALAYWSLQADYYDASGSYLSSDGVTHFRSAGTLGDDAEATIFGDVVTRMEGISGNALMDQSVQFSASYIEVPPLDELADPTGFGAELWMRAAGSDSSEKYRIVVDSATFVDGVAHGYILALNPCDQLEFWISTGLELSTVSPSNYSDCPPITNTTYECSLPCEGHAYLDNASGVTGELPPGVWHVIRTVDYNWTTWRQVAFGWAADDVNNCTLDTVPCSGQQGIHVNGRSSNTSTTPYLPSTGTPITVGGTGRLPLGSWSGGYNIEPFVGVIDEVSFYSSPLSPSAISQHYFYGSTENQPIWITVEGRDGVGTGMVPDVEYPEWSPAFTEEVVVDWESVQSSELTVANTSAVRFDWTG